MDIKTAILANTFAEKLRGELIVDEAQFDQLCNSLEQLKKYWRNETMIDKELMQIIYGNVMITLNMAKSFSEYNPELAEKIEEMGIILDGLILDCLATYQIQK